MLKEVPTNVSSGTLATSVYDKIHADVLSGTLPPGQKLRAEFLRDRYKVGNSPIREALNRLSAEGLVSREDQKGFRVSTVSKEELLELVKTRCWLEEIGLRESIANGGPDWEERLVLTNHRLARVDPSVSDAAYAFNPEWENLHRDYHRALLSESGSRWLIGFSEQLLIQSDRYRFLSLASSYHDRDEQGEHQAIIDACIARDVDQAVKCLREHYEGTANILLENVELLSGSSD